MGSSREDWVRKETNVKDFEGWVKMRHDRIEDGRNPAVPRRNYYEQA